MVSGRMPIGMAEVESTQTRTSKTASPPKGRIVLVSKDVMHYRVSVYNYLHRRFREGGFEFSVLTGRVTGENQRPTRFPIRVLPPNFAAYRTALIEADPVAVILFMNLKDWYFWPLIHWLKLKNIPFAFWAKGGEWDAKGSRIRRALFDYVYRLSDALLLYGEACRPFVNPRDGAKTFFANNTVNFADYPIVTDSKDDIKREFNIPFAKTVIFVGRMGAEGGRKRVEHLIDIFRELDRKDVGLVLVGSGLSDEQRNRLNPRNTVYLGEVHDPDDMQISKLCKMADVCAIPGHVGLGLNQAFYWGIPVVTEEGNHPPEISYLKPGRNGFVVPEGDLEALKNRILYLLDHDEVRAEFSKYAREDILAEASIEGMFSGFNQCVQFLSGVNGVRTRRGKEGEMEA
jgi:glycosyltransferase involved in cell wall biosynthesis